jgi:S-adenosylmethionine:tRNA ribosyltransferase-isomerase
MKTQELDFSRPETLQAASPPEIRGIARDEVRLMVSTPEGHQHTQFFRIADYLRPDDLLVVNRSATLAASLPATRSNEQFIVNLSTNYGNGLWLAEPRLSPSEPGSLSFEPGDLIELAGQPARLVAPYPGLPRLWYVQAASTLCLDLDKVGTPIRYGYVDGHHPLDAYQTIFSRIPGSAEMPSAARPFTPRVLTRLGRKGVRTAGIVLHTGVSSLEVETDELEDHVLYPEPYQVPRSTAAAVNATREAGGRVIAVGTTVVRALESAWGGEQVKPSKGFTRLYVHPQRGVNAVDGLVTGLHDPLASHLAMLYAIAGQKLVRSAYEEAVEQGYLWHEFGDSHLILGE